MVVHNNILAGASGATSGTAEPYKISRSLRFNSGDSSYLNRTFATGSRTAWSFSAWVKKAANGKTVDQCLFGGYGASNDTDWFEFGFGGSNDHNPVDTFYWTTNNSTSSSTPVFRDNSAWYHCLVTYNGSNIKVYVNSTEVLTYSKTGNLGVNGNWNHTIGKSPLSSTNRYFDGYMAEVHFIDGQALAASDFGEYDSNNVWQPKAFADAGPNNGTQWSSSSTNFTNPGKGFNGNSGDYAEVSSSGAKGTFTFPSSITVSSNVTFAFSSGTSGNLFVNDSSTAMQGTSLQVQTISFTGTLTNISLQSSSQPVLYYFAVDGVPLIDNLSHNYGVNGFNLKFADNSSDAALGTDSSGNSNTWTVNNLIATAGLETARQGMDVVTYSGNGSTQSITGLNFQPDFVWLKRRDSGAWHFLFDSVRGSNKALFSNDASAESNYGSNYLDAFTSNGFTLGSNGDINGNNNTFVAWCWKAGGSASSNSNGSITSSVSANTTYGFSIVSYTGTGSAASVGHGLNSPPSFWLQKVRGSTGGWNIYHSSLGANKYLQFTSSASSTASGLWGSGPSSSVMNLAGGSGINDSGASYIAYCWSEVPGFSKFGSFTHSNAASSVTGLGFKPRFVLVKRTNALDSWYIFDSARNTNDILTPDTASAEQSGFAFTFNDDGFSWLAGSLNTGNHIYAAFADKPPGEIIDSLIDTPTNYEASSGNNGGNYATLNPLSANTNQTLSDGNLKCSATANQWGVAPTTIGITSGKYYFETTCTGTNYHYIGIANKD